MLYTEHDFLDRFGAAAADGFRGVEFVSPYEYEAEAVADSARRAGVEGAEAHAKARQGFAFDQAAEMALRGFGNLDHRAILAAGFSRAGNNFVAVAEHCSA